MSTTEKLKKRVITMIKKFELGIVSSSLTTKVSKKGKISVKLANNSVYMIYGLDENGARVPGEKQLLSEFVNKSVSEQFTAYRLKVCGLSYTGTKDNLTISAGKVLSVLTESYPEYTFVLAEYIARNFTDSKQKLIARAEKRAHNLEALKDAGRDSYVSHKTELANKYFNEIDNKIVDATIKIDELSKVSL